MYLLFDVANGVRLTRFIENIPDMNYLTLVQKFIDIFGVQEENRACNQEFPGTSRDASC